MKHTIEVPVSRLRQELATMGMDTDGSRSDIVNRLHQAGVYQINTDTTYPPLHRNDYNPSNVLIGTNNAPPDVQNTLRIANMTHTLLSGDFKAHKVRVHDCLHIINSPDLSCETRGVEGDIRVKNGVLYMYRESNVDAGWYSLSFGRPLLF